MALGWRGQYNRYKSFYLNIVALYNQRQDLRAFLELILSLSTVIIFVIFALKPTALTIIDLYKQIQDKDSTLSTLTQKIQDLQTANSVLNQNKNAVADVDAAVFTNPQPDAISKQIIGIAAKDSVTLLGVSVGEVVLIGKASLPKASSDVSPLPASSKSMPIAISAKGNYSNLLAFESDIERLRIPVKIDTFSISSSQSDKGSVIVVNIVGRIPYIGS